MANIGDQLLSPETGWSRYLYNNANIEYYGINWFDDTHDYVTSTIADAKIKFEFTGTMMRLIHCAWSDRYTLAVSIDGVRYPDVVVNTKNQENTLVFNITGLADTLHTVIITPVTTTSAAYFGIYAVEIASTAVLAGHWLYRTKTDTNSMIIGDRIAFHYKADTVNTFGTIDQLGTSAAEEIPVSSSGTPDGTAYFIMVGYDSLGRMKLVPDRNIQHSISWDTLNTAGVASSSGLHIDIDGVPGYTLRLLSGGVNNTDKDNEWDKIIVESALNNTIIAGGNSIWNATNCWSGTSSGNTYGAGYVTVRGYSSISGSSYIATNIINQLESGFRPVLLVEQKNATFLIIKEDKAYSTISGVLTEVSSSFSTLTNTEKQALFTSSEFPPVSELEGLINFTLLVFTDSAVSNKVVINEVPFKTTLPDTYTPSIVATPKSQFIYATGDIDLTNASNLDWVHINNGIANSVTGNSMAKYIFSVDKGVTWKTYKDGAFINILDTANVLDGSIVGDRFVPTTEAMTRLLSDGLDKTNFDALPWNDISIALNNRLVRFATIFDMDKTTDSLFNDNIAYQYDGLAVWKQAVNGIDYEVRYNSPSKLEVKFITGNYKAKINF